VERAFRSLNGIDLLVRPIHHGSQERGAHLLCLVAYCVEWHLRRAWAPLLFADEELPEQRQQRDPILPATLSESAQHKKALHQTAEGFVVHSFSSLMAQLEAVLASRMA
jgi:hypothetical protein